MNNEQKNEDKKLSIVMDALNEFEETIDKHVNSIEDKKRELMNITRVESEKAKAKLIKEMKDEGQKTIENAKKEAESEAQKILAKATSDNKKLKTKIDKTFDKSVEHVIKTILGE